MVGPRVHGGEGRGEVCVRACIPADSSRDCRIVAAKFIPPTRIHVEGGREGRGRGGVHVETGRWKGCKRTWATATLLLSPSKSALRYYAGRGRSPGHPVYAAAPSLSLSISVLVTQTLRYTRLLIASLSLFLFSFFLSFFFFFLRRVYFEKVFLSFLFLAFYLFYCRIIDITHVEYYWIWNAMCRLMKRI